MYELRCPNCSGVMKSPFVRAGALATCQHCKNRFRVEPSHVTRLATPPPPPPRDNDPLLPEPAPTPAPSPQQQPQQASSQGSARPATAPATPAIPVESPEADLLNRIAAAQIDTPPTTDFFVQINRRKARRMAQQRQRRTMFIALGILVVLVVGILVAWMAVSGNRPAPVASGDATSTTGESADRPPRQPDEPAEPVPAPDPEP